MRRVSYYIWVGRCLSTFALDGGWASTSMVCSIESASLCNTTNMLITASLFSTPHYRLCTDTDNPPTEDDALPTKRKVSLCLLFPCVSCVHFIFHDHNDLPFHPAVLADA